MQPVKGAGVLAILKELPQATIVPMTVDGSWQVERYRMLPIPVGIRLTLHVLPRSTRRQFRVSSWPSTSIS